MIEDDSDIKAIEGAAIAAQTEQWRSRILFKSDGISPRRSYNNTAVFLRYHPDYRGRWSLDLMGNVPMLDDIVVIDTINGECRSHIEAALGYSPSVGDVDAAIIAACRERSFHPVQRYLEGLQWDGERRLEFVARDYLHSESEIAAEQIRRWMIGAVARVMRPGCKVDTSLMLIGSQGVGKSTFFRILGGQWHGDSMIDINNKDGVAVLQSAWISEFSELENAVGGKSESRLKAFVSSASDAYRAPYARAVAIVPRSGVICGTSNHDRFLTDATGSRRYWIVGVEHAIDCTALARWRDQLWAEALADFTAGAQWWLDTRLESLRISVNADHAADDPWVGKIAEYLHDRVTAVTTADLLGWIGVPIDRQTRADQSRVGKVMSTISGWEKTRIRISGQRNWVFLPVPTS